jgi:phenylacetate-coenzyme A ligase PaaK-like adenylate-forming protein
MGTDSVIYREKIKEMWGVYPLDVYGGTESLVVAMQAWDHSTMTFIPNLNFLEFIPEKEHMKWQLDNSYKPKTVLLDEVKPGENYEIVITNFHGGAMVRYRAGDMVRIVSLENSNTGVKLPQMVFERRADDLIDLGTIRLTERIIWQAIENTNIPYKDWTAHKEIVNGKAILRIFIELKNDYIASEKGVATAVYEEIKKLDDGFIHKDMAHLERLLGLTPLMITLLPEGAFANYAAQRQAEGADLAHLKPSHINPPEKVLRQLGVKVRPAAEEAVPEKVKASIKI